MRQTNGAGRRPATTGASPSFDSSNGVGGAANGMRAREGLCAPFDTPSTPHGLARMPHASPLPYSPGTPAPRSQVVMNSTGRRTGGQGGGAGGSSTKINPGGSIARHRRGSSAFEAEYGGTLVPSGGEWHRQETLMQQQQQHANSLNSRYSNGVGGGRKDARGSGGRGGAARVVSPGRGPGRGGRDSGVQREVAQEGLVVNVSRPKSNGDSARMRGGSLGSGRASFGGNRQDGDRPRRTSSSFRDFLGDSPRLHALMESPRNLMERVSSWVSSTGHHNAADSTEQVGHVCVRASRGGGLTVGRRRVEVQGC